MPPLKLHCGFQSIQTEGFFRSAVLKKGMELVKSSHTGDVCEIQDHGKGSVISGKCIPQTSVSKIPYSITVKVRNSFNKKFY